MTTKLTPAGEALNDFNNRKLPVEDADSGEIMCPLVSDFLSEASNKTIRTALEILDRIQRGDEIDQWQPIDTAPKNGMKIILYKTDYMYEPTIGYWNGQKWLAWRNISKPTHWMPLPAPPYPATENLGEGGKDGD